MSKLLDDGRAAPAGSPERVGSPVAAGLLAAVQAAGASLTAVLVPVVLTWASAAQSSAPWFQAFQLGVDAWLLAHGTRVLIPGGQVGLVPLGLLMVTVATCWVAGVRLARTLDPSAAAIRDGVGRGRPVLPPARALAAMVGGYVGLAVLACTLGTNGSVRPVAAQAVVGAAVIAVLGGLGGAATWAGQGRLAGLRLLLDRLGLHPAGRLGLLRRVLPAAGLAVTVQLGAGLVLLAGALFAGRDQVGLLHTALAPGLVGGAVLSVAQAAALPNFTVWAASYLAGPGFAVGSATVVRPGEVRLGPLPAVPVLGALPDQPLPAALAWSLPAVGALAGVVAGWWLARTGGATTWPALVAQAGLASATIALAWLALGWLAGGPAGPGRLAHTGPQPWLLALAMLGQSGTGLVAAAAARRWLRGAGGSINAAD